MSVRERGQLRPTLTPLLCPFCGVKPKTLPLLKDVLAGNAGSAYGAVYCASSRCFVNPIVRDGQEVADERGTGAYIDCAIKRWNKRKP